MEIPTYPYDSEYKNSKIFVRVSNQLEKYYRKSFEKYVDKIVTFSNDDSIFNIKTVKINNGIDLESISLKTTISKKMRFT